MEAKAVLLFNTMESNVWREQLQRTVSTLGRELEVSRETEVDKVAWEKYGLVLLDARGSAELVSLVLRIRGHHPKARIIAFSSSPDWKQARDVMAAGALDYVPKCLDHSHILAALKKGLDK